MGPCPKVGPPECGLETFVQMSPNLQKCLVSEVSSDVIAQLRGCTQMRWCEGNGHSPGEIECAEDSSYIRPETVVN